MGMLTVAFQGKHPASQGTGQWLLRASLAVPCDHAPPEHGRKEWGAEGRRGACSYESATLKLLLLPQILPSLSKNKG